MTPDRFLRVRHSRSSQVTTSNPIPWTLASIQATTSKGAGNGCANGYAATLGYRQKYGQWLVFQDARLPVTPPRSRSRKPPVAAQSAHYLERCSGSHAILGESKFR